MKSQLVVIFLILILATSAEAADKKDSVHYVDKNFQQKLLPTRPRSTEIAISVLFAGDIGRAYPPFLDSLVQEAKLLPERTSVVILGDIIYPIGLPEKESSLREQAERRLGRIIQAFKPISSQVYFVPGNHDWRYGHPGAYETVTRLEVAINQAFGEGHFHPQNGCRGPSEILKSKYLQLIAFDPMPWLLESDRLPPSYNSLCNETGNNSPRKSYARLVENTPTDTNIVVVTHHPLYTFGNHRWKSTCPSSWGCPKYQQMRKVFRKMFGYRQPFLCAAGHDHDQQILSGPTGCDFYLVTGGGSWTKRSGFGPGSLLTREEMGAMRLDILKNGKRALTVLSFQNDQFTEESISALLE